MDILSPRSGKLIPELSDPFVFKIGPLDCKLLYLNNIILSLVYCCRWIRPKEQTKLNIKSFSRKSSSAS